MADETPIYELTLLLSTDAEEETRTRILSDVCLLYTSPSPRD